MRRFLLPSLLVVAALLVGMLWRWSAGSGARAPGREAPSAMEGASRVEHGLLSQLREPERSDAAGARAIASHERDLAVANAVELAGVVVDASGSGVAGAQVALSMPAETDFPRLAELDGPRPPVVLARAASDARGAFRFFVANDRAYDLSARDPRGTVAFVRALRSGGEHVVHLRSAARVHGRVVRRADGKPLDGAVVRARAVAVDIAPAIELAATRTDAEGRFELDALAPGALELQAEHPSAYRERRELALEEGATREITLELEDGDLLGGVVSTANGQRPLAGATVELVGGESPAVTTGANGEFLVRGPPGAQDPEHEGGELLVRAHGHRARRVPLVEVRRTGRIVLDAAGSLRGRVVDEQGQPIASAGVALVPEPFKMPSGDRSRASLGATTDAAGVFELDGVALDGEWTLVVRGPARGYLTRFHAQPPAPPRKRLIAGTADQLPAEAIEAAQRATELAMPAPAALRDLGDLVVERAADVAGSVVDEHGAPIDGALVVLDRGTQPTPARTARASDDDELPQELVTLGFGPRALEPQGVESNVLANVLGVPDLALEVRTDALGTFRFQRVPPGQLVVRATHDRGDDETRADASKRAPTRESKAPIRLQPGRDVVGLQLVVPRCRPIAGVVVDPWGNPLRDIVVRHADETQVTDERGRFTLRAYGRERRALTASYASEYSLGNQTCRFADTTVDDVAPGTDRVVIQMRRSLPLGGKLVEDGKPFRGAVLAQDARGARIDVAFADEEGRFEVRAPEGELIELVVLGTSGDGATRRMRGESTPLVRLPHVEAGRTDLVVDVPRR